MKMRKKSSLPTKICPVCGRPFSWRKKWQTIWEEVKYCSDRCRGDRHRGDGQREGETKQAGKIS
ncbi:MAG: DUF2256 domain-containing protein [Cytophagaceae bacterium]|nr:DUF2256 domain-containing protein [Cytophagaceae bacterium]